MGMKNCDKENVLTAKLFTQHSFRNRYWDLWYILVLSSSEKYW